MSIYITNDGVILIELKAEDTTKSKSFNTFVEKYNPNEYLDFVLGLENEPEKGKRCDKCIELRLLKTAKKAKILGFDLFATTLTVSPLKDATRLNQLGKQLEEQVGVKYLASDFKKKGGYQRSVELSKEFNLYRQNYCGCKYSIWWE